MADQLTPSIADAITDEQDPVPPVTPAPEAPDYSDALASIKNKDGAQKFSTVNEALNSLTPANEHIGRLEEENATLREAAVKAKTTAEILEQLKPPAPAPTPPVVATVDDAHITALALQALSVKEKADLVKSNTKTVGNALAKEFGSKEKVTQALEAKASELGVGVQFLNDIAAKSPKALLQYFGMELEGASTPLPQKINAGIDPAHIPAPEQKKKGLMYGATSKEMTNEWKRHKPQD